MKILYIGGFEMPDGNAAAQRVLGIAKSLRENNHEIRFTGLSRTLSTDTIIGTVEGFHYINYPYPKGLCKWLKYLTGHDSIIDEIKCYKPNAVILYNHPALAIERILKYCHNNGIKVYADVTEWYDAIGNFFFRIIKSWDIKRRMFVSHLKLDGLICISSFLSNFYGDKGMTVVEVPPTVDLNQSKWKGLKEDSMNMVKFVYAGSPGSNKDRLDLVLEAMNEILPRIKKQIRFDVFGLSKEQYIEKWGNQNIQNYVVFHGRCPHVEVIEHLINSDFQIFLRPDTLTNRAGFPTKYVESVTTKTLPITNLSSNLKDYLKDGYNGFIIESLDKDAIQQALTKALILTRAEIESLKHNQKIMQFDYRNYTTALNTLFS